MVRVQPQPHVSMVNHQVMTGRKISFKFLQNEQFQIGDWIQKQTSIGEVLYIGGTIYPKLVSSFFENLRIRLEAIKSTIKGTLIVIDKRRLGNILKIRL